MKGAILRRRWQSALAWAVTALAGMLLVGVLLHIVLFVLVRGGRALSPEILLTDTLGVAGGLRNAITGSIMPTILRAWPISTARSACLGE